MVQHRQVEKRRRPIFHFPASAKSFKVTANVMARNMPATAHITYPGIISLRAAPSASFGAKCTPAHFFPHEEVYALEVHSRQRCHWHCCDMASTIGLLAGAQCRGVAERAERGLLNKKLQLSGRRLHCVFQRGPRALFNFPHLSSSRSFGARERRGDASSKN
jgi:hypothetical protein